MRRGGGRRGRTDRVLAALGRTDVLAVTVLAHVPVSIAHGWLHLSLPVPVPAWQYGVAGVFVVAGPIAGLSLVGLGRRRLGGTVLVATFSVAFAFESLAHFVVENPDHVGTVVRGRRAFAWTAVAAVLTDAVGALAALQFRWRADEGS